MTATKLTTSKAKKIVSGLLEEQGFSFSGLKAKTVSFEDLGYGAGIFVTPKGLEWPEPRNTIRDKFRHIKSQLAAINEKNGWDGYKDPKIILDL